MQLPWWQDEHAQTLSSPSRSVSLVAEGEKILTSWSSPLTARTGMCGCGSKQLTCTCKKMEPWYNPSPAPFLLPAPNSSIQFTVCNAHHSFMVALKILHNLRLFLVPEEDMATVTPTHHVLTAQAKEVNSLHCGGRGRGGGRIQGNSRFWNSSPG